MKKPLFVLPAKPIDRYRVKWFVVNGGGVRERSAEFIIFATWGEICPDDWRKTGAPFSHQWRLFDGADFVGRVQGWKEIEGFPGDHGHGTWAAARRAAIASAKSEITNLRERLIAAEDCLVALKNAKEPK